MLGPTVGPLGALPLISQSGSRASLEYFILPFYLNSLILLCIILLLYFAVCKEFSFKLLPKTSVLDG